MGEMPLGSCRPTVDRDANLVEALRRQEAGAAEALIAAYGDRAYRLAMRMTGNRSDAEEVVQDAFWTVVQKIETFRGDPPFGSWLYRITANCAYTRLRVRRARHHETSLDEGSVMVDEHAASLQDWSARVEDPALQFELRTVLTAALDTLPEDYRAVLVLRDVEGSQPDHWAECRRREDSSAPCAAGAAQVPRGALLGSAAVAPGFTFCVCALAAPRRMVERVDAAAAAAAVRASYLVWAANLIIGVIALGTLLPFEGTAGVSVTDVTSRDRSIPDARPVGVRAANGTYGLIP